MKATPCMKQGGEFKQCLQQVDASAECQKFRTAYLNCKRETYDMRVRITGPKNY